MRKVIPLIIFGVLLVVVFIKLWPLMHDFFPTATHVVFHPGASLREINGRTNVVLLGIGGGTHDGPNLTDTIIFASIDWAKNKVTLVSIPRDLWVPRITNSLKKINEAYALGGLSQAESIVNAVTGQPVDYGIRLDFQGFVDALNQIGGIDITVVRTLDDYNYPISGKEDDACGHSVEDIQTFTATASADTDTFTFFPCRFKHLHFDPGLQHMDGETALEFVRSRHALGIEGSDFARSSRQQLVIEAVRSKLISSAFFNPGKLLGLYGIIKDSIDTDIADTDLGLFLDKLPILKGATIVSAGLDAGDYITNRPGLLVNAPMIADYDFSATLIPRIGNGDFSEIQQYISCEITKGNCPIAAVSGTPTPSPKQAK